MINRIAISIDNDDEHHKALVERQTKNDKIHDIARNYSVLYIGSTTGIKREDGDRWTHDTIIGKGDHNHHDWSYIVWVMKTGRTITRSSKHIKAAPIAAEQYLWDQLKQTCETRSCRWILKHYEQQHKNKNTNNEKSYNNYNYKHHTKQVTGKDT